MCLILYITCLIISEKMKCIKINMKILFSKFNLKNMFCHLCNLNCNCYSLFKKIENSSMFTSHLSCSNLNPILNLIFILYKFQMIF